MAVQSLGGALAVLLMLTPVTAHLCPGTGCQCPRKTVFFCAGTERVALSELEDLTIPWYVTLFDCRGCLVEEGFIPEVQRIFPNLKTLRLEGSECAHISDFLGRTSFAITSTCKSANLTTENPNRYTTEEVTTSDMSDTVRQTHSPPADDVIQNGIVGPHVINTDQVADTVGTNVSGIPDVVPITSDQGFDFAEDLVMGGAFPATPTIDTATDVSDVSNPLTEVSSEHDGKLCGEISTEYGGLLVQEARVVTPKLDPTKAVTVIVPPELVSKIDQTPEVMDVDDTRNNHEVPPAGFEENEFHYKAAYDDVAKEGSDCYSTEGYQSSYPSRSLKTVTTDPAHSTVEDMSMSMAESYTTSDPVVITYPATTDAPPVSTLETPPTVPLEENTLLDGSKLNVKRGIVNFEETTRQPSISNSVVITSLPPDTAPTVSPSTPKTVPWSMKTRSDAEKWVTAQPNTAPKSFVSNNTEVLESLPQPTRSVLTVSTEGDLLTDVEQTTDDYSTPYEHTDTAIVSGSPCDDGSWASILIKLIGGDVSTVAYLIASVVLNLVSVLITICLNKHHTGRCCPVPSCNCLSMRYKTDPELGYIGEDPPCDGMPEPPVDDNNPNPVPPSPEVRGAEGGDDTFNVSGNSATFLVEPRQSARKHKPTSCGLCQQPYKLGTLAQHREVCPKARRRLPLNDERPSWR